MYAPVLPDLAFAFAVGSLLLAAVVAPSAAQPPSFSLDPILVSNVSVRWDSESREEQVEVLMADLVQEEVQAFLRSLKPASHAGQSRIREVEVFNVYSPEGEDVVHQEQEIRMRYQDGSSQDLRLRRSQGSKLLPPPRQVVEKKLDLPPRFAPVRTGADLEAVELEIHREASVAYESEGYRSSWFGEG